METTSPVIFDFILFCHQRCGGEWPDLYDEMCRVAGRRLFHDMGYAELRKAGLSLCIASIDDTIRMVDDVTSKSNGPGSKV